MGRQSRAARRRAYEQNGQNQNGHKPLPNRHQVKSRSGELVDISRIPATAGYRSVPHIWFQRPIDLPPFSFQTIRGMLLDPGIRLNFATRAAPICSAQFGYKQGEQWTEGVECKYPEVAEFIYKQLQHVWRNFLPMILRAQVWGWSGGEVTLKLSEVGLVEIAKMEPRHASDVRLLKKGHERWGISVNRVEEAGTVHLPFPRAFFHAYNAEDGEDYGVSAAIGAYSPWADKWFNGGGLDVRRLFMHKDAYGGMDLGYPEGETWVAGINDPVPNSDIARQIVEQIVSGGVTTRPSARDENGNEKWPLTRATVANNPQHILQYPKDLDDEIRRGMEIPDDVISADGGGAWAGKRVTIASFYASLDHWVVQILCDLKEQLFDHLIELNFGKVPDYEIRHKPLAEQAMEQQSNAGPGGPPGMADDPMMGGAPPMPGMGADPMGMQPDPMAAMQPPPPMPGPQMMSLLGEGELTVAEVLEAGKRVARLSVKTQEKAEEEPATEDEFEVTQDRIELLAEILAAVFGDDAEEMLDAILPEEMPVKLAVWNPDDHPRGPNGRFIPKGTGEAYDAAKAKVDEAHRSRSPESMADLMSHMNTLTTKQLHQLKRDYGTKASAKTKAALIQKLSERLTSGRHRTERRANDTPVAPVREDVYTVPTDALKIDPARFQYKVKGIGAKGVGQELKGTSQWNPELGGVILVWRDPENGEDYVVNGHHRHELATRSGADSMNVRYIDAKDAKQARSVGALANIAEGRGSAIDAAKYLRDTGQDVEHFKRAGISMSGKIASEAAILTKLSDRSFAAVTQGRLEEDTAIAVAKHLDSPELQDKLLQKIAKREEDGKEWSTSQIEQASKKMARAGSITESGTDLFGDFESEESTFDQEVEIEAFINRQLSQEANDFAAVSSTRRAERISDTGNVLNVDANTERRDQARSAIADFEREAGLRGPVADTIKKYAADLARATKKADREKIKQEALKSVREALAEVEAKTLAPSGGSDTGQSDQPDWLQTDTRANDQAKPGDQLGMFGEVANVPQGQAKLDEAGETRGRAQNLFDTSGDPDQLLMFDDGVTPDDRLGDEAKAERESYQRMISEDTWNQFTQAGKEKLIERAGLKLKPAIGFRYLSPDERRRLAVAASELSIAMSLLKGKIMKDLELSPEEAAEVEKQVRELLSLSKDEQKAVMMSLQPGATKNIGGTQYVLNRNHRWTRQQQGGQPQQRQPKQQQYNPQQRGNMVASPPTMPAQQQQPQPKPAEPSVPSVGTPTTNPADKTQIDEESTTPPPPGKAFVVDVEKVGPDGVAETARVGIPGRVVAPPPPIPRLPNLTQHERQVESKFIEKFMADPDGVALEYRKFIAKTDKPYTFETDQAKCLSDDWNDDDLDAQMAKRQSNNNALHQTANAVVKRAFLQHLNTLKPGDSVLVTVGGCGSGKGYTLKNTELGKNLTAQAKAVWDSAGDQNATENPWILEEASKRGLVVTYAYVAGDPKVAWADPGRGVVTRAHDKKDGRMVDAAVFADSYVLGAKNHHAFHQANKDNPNAKFLFFSAKDQSVLPGVPEESLKMDRKSLYHWAMGSIQGRSDVAPTVLRGATQGARIWNQELG